MRHTGARRVRVRVPRLQRIGPHVIRVRGRPRPRPRVAAPLVVQPSDRWRPMRRVAGVPWPGEEGTVAQDADLRVPLHLVKDGETVDVETVETTERTPRVASSEVWVEADASDGWVEIVEDESSR